MVHKSWVIWKGVDGALVSGSVRRESMGRG